MKPFAQVNRTRYGANGSAGKKERLRAGNDLVWVPAEVYTERSKLERAACFFFLGQVIFRVVCFLAASGRGTGGQGADESVRGPWTFWVDKRGAGEFGPVTTGFAEAFFCWNRAASFAFFHVAILLDALILEEDARRGGRACWRTPGNRM